MKNFVYIESQAGEIKPSVREAIQYAQALDPVNHAVTAWILGTPSAEMQQRIGQYGVEKLICLEGVPDNQVHDPRVVAHALQAYLSSVEGPYNLVIAQSTYTELLAAVLAVPIDAAVASRVVSLPESPTDFRVQRRIYTGKAFEEVLLDAERKLLLIQKNITLPAVQAVESLRIEKVPVQVSDDHPIRLLKEEKATQEVSLPEADIVVSGGRGMKGPEHWHLVEALARVLGAATACSKPVSDMEWRPHHEHVGQTGLKVSPSLYIAIGISGAVQHLAGVNGSRVMVVINKDPEAPFFKAADYGIVGDVFEVLPRLTKALAQENT